MAYDQGSAYEPPSRAYYGQQHPQAPVQAGHLNGPQQEYDQRKMTAYEQKYGQQQAASYGGYEQDMNYNARRGYGQAPVQQGYNGGYQQEPNQQNGGYTPQERSYDPRYQQRQGRSVPQAQGQHPGERARPPPQRQDFQQAEQAYAQSVQQQYQAQPSSHQRPDPSNGQQPGLRGHPPAQGQAYPVQASIPPQQDMRNRQQPAQQKPRVSFEQQSADIVSPPRQQGNGQAPAPRPAQPAKPHKMTMEEWKAQEKAKMHQAALSPETMPQDNAFPTFPSKKKEGRTNGMSAMSHRSSEEQARPSTSNSHRASDSQQERRPSALRNASYNNEEEQPRQGSLQRPNVDHKPFSFEPIESRPSQNSQQRPSNQRQPSATSAQSPVDGRQQQQWPMHAQQQYQQQLAPDRRSPPRQDGYGQANHDRAPTAHAQQPQQPRQGQSRGLPPVMPIDTRRAQEQQRPVYAEQQPLSPVVVPPRPSTSNATRAPPVQRKQLASPTSAYSHSATPHDYQDVVPSVPKPWAGEQRTKHESLGDVYDGYYDDRATPMAAAPRTRDEEIEADMPDFDSAAPGGTSMLHKRLADAPAQSPAARPPMSSMMTQQSVQSVQSLPAQARPPMSTMPTQQSVQSVQSLPAPRQHFYHQEHDSSVASLPADQRVAKHKAGGITEGFVFGVPGEQAPYDQFGGAGRTPQQQRDQLYNQGAQMARPQPAFANEQPGRRSMDDGRQMRNHHGPPQPQRFDQNGQRVRGGFGAQPQQQPQRPDFDRNGTAQTVWSDPGAQRVGSAPPQRQGLQAPTSRGPSGGAPNGIPLSQQRSAPEVQLQQHHVSNPDALPHHPMPVRPGLQQSPPASVAQPTKPVPIRNYDAASVAPHQRQASIDLTLRPVTHQELDQLRAAVSANPNNNKQALLLAKKLVEAGNTLASEGGRLDPKSTAKNREKYILDAHKRIKKLVSAGYADAQFYLADCYGQGSLGLEVDTKEAFNLYQAAAKAGHAAAAYRTAVCCEMGPEEGGGTRKDFAKAVQWYRRAAALGDIAAMYKLGMILLKGLLGQPRNVGESVIWLKRAAERADKDNPHALHELGLLHDAENTDVEVRNKIIPDEQYSRELFQQAADLGYKFSQFRLGQAYEYGTLGLTIDNRASISWYSKAAAQGEHQAELALSGWYLTGAEGILVQSDTEAYLWARKAASSEPPLAKAMFAMGYFSENGIGCPANVEEARRWYGRAASYKFPKALERLEELKKSGGKRPQPANGKLTRKDQKRDEAECVVM